MHPSQKDGKKIFKIPIYYTVIGFGIWIFESYFIENKNITNTIVTAMYL